MKQTQQSTLNKFFSIKYKPKPKTQKPQPGQIIEDDEIENKEINKTLKKGNEAIIRQKKADQSFIDTYLPKEKSNLSASNQKYKVFTFLEDINSIICEQVCVVVESDSCANNFANKNVGSKCLKKNILDKHLESERHLQNVQTLDNIIQRIHDQELVKTGNTLEKPLKTKEDKDKSVILLFKTAYFIHKMGYAITHYEEFQTHLKDVHNSLIHDNYYSQNSQTLILKAIGGSIYESILQKINQCEFITILLYGTKNVQHKEEIILHVKYVDKQLESQEYYLKCYQQSNQTGKGYFEELKLQLGQNFHKLVFLGSDNENKMSGEYEGLDGNLQKTLPWTMFYGCIAHKESICCKHMFDNSSKHSISELQDFYAIIHDTYQFVNNSNKRKMLFDQICQDFYKEARNLLDITKGRWNAIREAVVNFQISYPALVIYFQKFKEQESQNKYNLTENVLSQITHSLENCVQTLNDYYINQNPEDEIDQTPNEAFFSQFDYYGGEQLRLFCQNITYEIIDSKETIYYILGNSKKVLLFYDNESFQNYNMLPQAVSKLFVKLLDQYMPPQSKLIQNFEFLDFINIAKQKNITESQKVNFQQYGNIEILALKKHYVDKEFFSKLNKEKLPIKNYYQPQRILQEYQNLKKYIWRYFSVELDQILREPDNKNRIIEFRSQIELKILAQESNYKNILLFYRLYKSISVSNASVERSFSQLKNSFTDKKNRLLQGTLDNIMHIKINGVKHQFYNPTKDIEKWKKDNNLLISN